MPGRRWRRAARLFVYAPTPSIHVCDWPIEAPSDRSAYYVLDRQIRSESVMTASGQVCPPSSGYFPTRSELAKRAGRICSDASRIFLLSDREMWLLSTEATV
jgi:hypothetical protein